MAQDNAAEPRSGQALTGCSVELPVAVQEIMRRQPLHNLPSKAGKGNFLLKENTSPEE